jgi:hypothetical protein
LANKQIRRSGKPNKDRIRFEVSSRWNLEEFKKLLIESKYEDMEIIEYMKYGWPISHDGSIANCERVDNWKGAKEYPEDVKSYLEKEIKHQAVLGPFEKNPFHGEAFYSPLNTRSKKDSEERRIIVDLSHPEHKSVNLGIDKSKYLGEGIKLSFPKVYEFAELVREKGVGSTMFKRDMRRYYRQIPIDPGDTHMLGYQFDGKEYFDCVLPMGMTSSAYIAQRVSNAILGIFKSKGRSGVIYIDDLAGVEVKSNGEKAFEEMKNILEKVGVEESVSKACKPSTNMKFLGIEIDSVKMEMRIDKDRVKEIREELIIWYKKDYASLKEVQSLLGKLNFAASCVVQGRLFISRIIDFLKQFRNKRGKLKIGDDLKKDVEWWQRFMVSYNGRSIIPENLWFSPDVIMSTDACLEGGGGFSNGKFFHIKFPVEVKEKLKDINSLELYTVLIAVRVWKEFLIKKNFNIYCDNEVSVININSGRSKVKSTQSMLRELRYHEAQGEFQIRAKHIAGVENRIADCLSRWEFDEKYKKEFEELTKEYNLEEFKINDFDLYEYW